MPSTGPRPGEALSWRLSELGKGLPTQQVPSGWEGGGERPGPSPLPNATGPTVGHFKALSAGGGATGDRVPARPSLASS